MKFPAVALWSEFQAGAQILFLPPSCPVPAQRGLLHDQIAFVLQHYKDITQRSHEDMMVAPSHLVDYVTPY